MSPNFDILKEFDNAFKMSFGWLLLAWASTLTFLKVENSFWWTGLALTIAFLAVFFLVNKYSASYGRAWIFHVMIFLTGLPGFLGVLDALIRFLAYVPDYQVWKWFMGWFLVLIGMIWQTGFTTKHLLQNLDEDVSTGRLSFDKQTWNLSVPSSIDKNQSIWMKIGNVTSPLVVALAFWLSRNSEQGGYELAALLMYIFILIGFLGFSRQLAFAIFLRQIEKTKQVGFLVERSA
jgi:hypothetical protein